MADKPRSFNARPVSDLSSEILDPMLRKRAGISVGLVQSWEEIVGARVAGQSRPEKIFWPKRMYEDDPFQPATLVVACQSIAAMHIQHEAGEIISRINGFLGFPAIGRIRIVQKPVSQPHQKAKPQLRPLTEMEQQGLDDRLGAIEDDDLRKSLAALGHSIIGRRKS